MTTIPPRQPFPTHTKVMRRTTQECSLKADRKCMNELTSEALLRDERTSDLIHTFGSWYKKLMSLGRCRFERTNSASPGGPVAQSSAFRLNLANLVQAVYPPNSKCRSNSRSALVFPASILWMLMQILSTLCTGLHPCESSKSRHIIPLL